MAEALGIASSIAGLAQLSIAVFQNITKFYREAKEADSYVGNLATQTRNLAGVLQNLSLLASSLTIEENERYATFKAPYIGSCFSTLRKIESRVQKARDDLESGNRRKILVRSLKWPFSIDETKTLVAELSDHKDTLGLALSADNLRTLLECLSATKNADICFSALQEAVTKKFSIDTRVQLDEHRQAVLDFFSEVNPQSNLEACRQLRQPETGKWLLERNTTFRQWEDIPGSSLWLSGIPGAGKTILCGSVIEKVLQMSSESIAVAFFFCDYNSPKSRIPVNILASLSAQLAHQSTSAFEILETYYEKLNPKNRLKAEPNAQELVEILIRMVSLFEHVYLVIDGLDECGKDIHTTVKILKQLSREPQVRIALFSREDEDIREEIEEDYAHIEISAHTEDLELYVLAKMDQYRSLKNLGVNSPELYEYIRRTLIESASGMFRWVACQLDYLNDLPNNKMRRKALAELPPTLFGTYDRILDRILQCPEDAQAIFRKALHWIGLGEYAPTIPQLCEAASIPDGVDIIDDEDIVPHRDISRFCSSLIRRSHGTDRFEYAHFTVKEYLQTIAPGSKRGLFRFSEEEANRSLLRISLRFLTFPSFSRRPLMSIAERQYMEERNQRHPFYPFAAEYAFGFRADYIRRSAIKAWNNLDEVALGYAQQLLGPEKSNLFSSWVLQVIWEDIAGERTDQLFIDTVGLVRDSNFSSLHVAAMLALPMICKALLNNGTSVNKYSRLMGTPLHALVVGRWILMDYKLGTSTQSYDRKLHWREKHDLERAEKVVTMILDNGADANMRWRNASVLQLALGAAIPKGNSDTLAWIIPFLRPSTPVEDDFLESFEYAIANSASISTAANVLNIILAIGTASDASAQWTALASMARRIAMSDRFTKYEDPRRLQLECSSLSVLSDSDFPIVVQIAATQNLIEDLKFLVEDNRFTGSNLRFGEQKSTLLHVAAENGSTEAVDLLLNAGIDSNLPDNCGWTPLHASCNNGHAGSTLSLIKAGASDLLKNRDGFTAWHLAATHGSVKLLNVLLKACGDTKTALTTTSGEGRAPLACAIHKGHVGATLLILDYCHTEPEFYQSDSCLLNQAAAMGSKQAFCRLQEKRVDTISATMDNSTPLHHIHPFSSPCFVDHLVSRYRLDSVRNNGDCPLVVMILRLNNLTLRGQDDDRSDITSESDVDTDDDTLENCDRNEWVYGTNFRHNVAALVPNRVGDAGDQIGSRHVWEIFCETIITELSVEAIGRPPINPIIIALEILLERGALSSYESKYSVSGVRPLLTGLLARRQSNLSCKCASRVLDLVLRATEYREELASYRSCTDLLLHAIRDDNVTLTGVLLENGADVHKATGMRSAIEEACYSARWNMFKLLIERLDGNQINKRGYEGNNLLHFAILGGSDLNIDKIKELVRRGADLNARVDDIYQYPAMVLASRQQDASEVVMYMISQGADPLPKSNTNGWSVLHGAAMNGSVRVIKQLKSANMPQSFWIQTCSVYFEDLPMGSRMIFGVSAMHMGACYHEHIVRFLLEENLHVNINATTTCKNTPLHLAAWNGRLDTVKFLIDNGANLSARNSNQWLPLDCAIDAKHPEVAKILVASGSGKPSASSFSDTILKAFTIGGDEDSNILTAHDSSEPIIDAAVYLESAIVNGNLGLCKRLTTGKCSIEIQLPSCRPCSALARAIRANKPLIIEWLLSMEARPENTPCSLVHPALWKLGALATHHISSTICLKRVLSYLLAHNVSWYGGDMSPFHIAILNNNGAAFKFILYHIKSHEDAYRRMIDSSLVVHPADKAWSTRSVLSILINEVNKHSDSKIPLPWPRATSFACGTPLHFAIQCSNIHAVELLLGNDADINSTNTRKETPLILAARLGHKEIVKKLLEAGADTSFRDLWSCTALMRATINRYVDVAWLLARTNSAVLDQVDGQGSCLLHFASTVEYFEYLVSRGLSPFQTNIKGRSPIETAIETNRLSGYIFNSGLLLECQEWSLNPIVPAIRWNNIRLLKWLFRVLPREQMHLFADAMLDPGWSPLCLAADKNQIHFAEELIALGADVCLEGSPYGSPLMVACIRGQIAMARLLIRCGSPIYYTNSSGVSRNAFLLAATHPEMQKWFLLGRFIEQNKLMAKSACATTGTSVWSGPRTFRISLPEERCRRHTESRFEHLKRLEAWKRTLRGCVLVDQYRGKC